MKKLFFKTCKSIWIYKSVFVVFILGVSIVSCRVTIEEKDILPVTPIEFDDVLPVIVMISSTNSVDLNGEVDLTVYISSKGANELLKDTQLAWTINEGAEGYGTIEEKESVIKDWRQYVYKAPSDVPIIFEDEFFVDLVVQSVENENVKASRRIVVHKKSEEVPTLTPTHLYIEVNGSGEGDASETLEKITDEGGNRIYKYKDFVVHKDIPVGVKVYSVFDEYTNPNTLFFTPENNFGSYSVKNANPKVTLSIKEGSAYGTIINNNIYRSPDKSPTSQSSFEVTIVAKSHADSNVIGERKIIVNLSDEKVAPIKIISQKTRLGVGVKELYKIEGSALVTWSIKEDGDEYGRLISPSSFQVYYKAADSVREPIVVTIVARHMFDLSVKDEVKVTVVPPIDDLQIEGPDVVFVGEPVQFTVNKDDLKGNTLKYVVFNRYSDSMTENGLYTATSYSDQLITIQVSSLENVQVKSSKLIRLQIPSVKSIKIIGAKSVESGTSVGFSVEVDPPQANDDVSWSIKETGDEYGSISENGVYSAPVNLAGETTFTVVAVSKENENIRAEKLITINALPEDFVIEGQDTVGFNQSVDFVLKSVTTGNEVLGITWSIKEGEEYYGSINADTGMYVASPPFKFAIPPANFVVTIVATIQNGETSVKKEKEITINFESTGGPLLTLNHDTKDRYSDLSDGVLTIYHGVGDVAMGFADSTIKTVILPDTIKPTNRRYHRFDNVMVAKAFTASSNINKAVVGDNFWKEFGKSQFSYNSFKPQLFGHQNIDFQDYTGKTRTFIKP